MKLFSQQKKNNSKDVKNKKNNKKKQKEPMTVQDLIKFDEITEKGIVRIGKSYICVMESGQTNLHLLDFNENATVWSNFRTMLNSINIRHSYILQSRFFDVSDFVKEYNEKADTLTNLTPQLLLAKEDVIKNYGKFTEERNRDQVGYIIFRYNPDTEGLEMGLETGNPTIDELIKKFKSAAKEIDQEESRSIAVSVLEEVSDLAYQLLQKLNIRSVRLNKVGVLDMVYSTLNRDLTLAQRLQDVSDAHSFTEFKTSRTPELIAETLKKMQEQDEVLFEEYYQNFELEVNKEEGELVESTS